MYYRVAIQVDASSTWKWKSTALSSLNILLQWLHLLSGSSARSLTHLLFLLKRGIERAAGARERGTLVPPQTMATQFLQERMLAPHVRLYAKD